MNKKSRVLDRAFQRTIAFNSLMAFFLGGLFVNSCCAHSKTWEGFYIGANGGVGWGKARWLFPEVEYYNDLASQSFTTHPKGELIGVQVGLQHQVCSWNMGIESAFEWNGLTDDEVGAVVPTFPGDLFQTKFNKIWQIVAKGGYVYQDWLMYAKAGYVNSQIIIGALSANPGAGVSATNSHRQGGWLLGFGVDYRILPKASLGLQYDFNNFSNKDYNSITEGNSVGLPFNIRMKNLYFSTLTARLNIYID